MLKYIILVVASVFWMLAALIVGAHKASAAELEVIQTEKPAMCQTRTEPMPCAFILAMIEKMRSHCQTCNGNKTCAVNLPQQ